MNPCRVVRVGVGAGAGGPFFESSSGMYRVRSTKEDAEAVRASLLTSDLQPKTEMRSIVEPDPSFFIEIDFQSSSGLAPGVMMPADGVPRTQQG